MFRAPRLSRPKRSIVATIVITVALALPAGVVLASHQFGDVPNSNPFHSDIDALVDSGITAGCGSGNYCPKANVTREQMAAFMNRLGALAPGKPPVVNADRVDGYHASGLTRVAQGVGSEGYTELSTADFDTITTVTIQVPAKGFVTVNGSNTLVSASGCPCTAMMRLWNQADDAVSPLQLEEVGAALAYSSIGLDYVFAVPTAGSYTFALEAAHYAGPGGAGSFGPFDAVLAASYSPFGSTGGAVLYERDPDVPQSGTPGLP